ncbi:MAG: DUF6464 family protein [Cyanobacteria bacterium P01_D01_bin.73]
MAGAVSFAVLTKGLTIFCMFVIAIAPAIAALLSLRQIQAQRMAAIANTRLARRLARRLVAASMVNSVAGGRSPVPDDPEAIYIPDFGFVIGDISCQFNGRSPYLRCAVNPDGPCANCRSYQELASNP